MFCECLSRLPAELTRWQPCPSIDQRDGWETLPEATRKRVISGGEHFLEKEIPFLSASQYLAFPREGNRVIYEKPYFTRRRILCHLVTAECCENKGRFVDRIVDLIWAICEETAWQVPAHNAYIRNIEQGVLPDWTRPVIDLFAAETGALLAMTYYMMKPRLDEVSPLICQRIEQEMQQRIFEPYLNCHFWWMGRGDEPMNNWTPWCTQNVLVAASLMPIAEAAQKAVLRKAACSLDCFVNQYGEDGCCDEGAQYYGAAAVCLFGALDVMSSVAPEAFENIWKQPKLRAMADFILKVHVADKYYLNFSDCSPVPGRRTGREFYFAKRMNNQPLMAFTAQDFLKDPDPDMLDDIFLSGGINLYYAVLQLFNEHEMHTCSIQPTAAPSFFFPSTQLLIARHGGYVLGAKAGCNDDSHNHNDTGSVTLYKNDQPFLVDIGVENYTKKTFSPQRYEIWTMQSGWHNLPRFGEIDQNAGAEYRATEVSYNIGETESEMTANIAAAYPSIGGLSYYRRHSLLSENGLLIEDETDYPDTVHLTLMLLYQPSVEGNVIHVGALGTITCSDCEITTQAVPITDSRLRAAWPDTLWRVNIAFKRKLHLKVQ